MFGVLVHSATTNLVEDATDAKTISYFSFSVAIYSY
jgi:hypothetical protein